MVKFLLGILWLAASVYVGYVLTDRSFAFLEDPGFGLGEEAPLTQILKLDPKTITDKLPRPGESPETWYASLSEATQTCLKNAVSEKTFQDALAGRDIAPSPSEALAISICLK